MEQQAQWAAALKRAQRSGAIRQRDRASNETLEQQRIHTQEALIAAAEKKDFEETKHYFTDMISILAKQTSRKLEAIQAEPDPDRQLDASERVYNQYQKQCIELALAVDTILGIKHDL